MSCLNCSKLQNELDVLTTSLAAVTRLLQESRPIPPKKAQTTGPYNSREELRGAIAKMIDTGLTGKEVAHALGMSQATVSRIRNGDHKQRDDGMPKHAATQWRLHER